ncbi:MAG: glycosyltransferase family 39 protein [Bacteroidota bacterium]
MKKIKIIPVLFVVAGLVIFAYIAVKATVSSFTHDESFSYLRYVSHSFMDLISNKDAYTNNHILNTLCMKYSEMIFGNSVLALRLPNLLLLVVFFAYAYLLLRKINPVTGLCIFILMATNTALIDFFGLARGYGLSIGFMTMSLYSLVQSFEEKRTKNLVLFNIGALLAIFSNFTLLTFYVAALVAYNFIILQECRFSLKEKGLLLKANTVNLVSLFGFLVVLYEPVRKAVKFNSFDFGGKHGFMHDTGMSVIYHLFNNIPLNPAGILVIQVALSVIILIPFVLILKNLVLSKTEFFSRFRSMVIINLVFLLIAAETVVQHYLLKTDYLVGRFSLFLVPLLMLNFGFFMEYLMKFRFRGVIYTFVIVLSLLSAVNFYRNTNLYSCAEWNYDRETKNAVLALIRDHQAVAGNQRNIKLGINWLFEPTINFYRSTWNLSWLLPVDRDGLTSLDQYEYIFTADTAGVKNKNYDIIFSSDITGTRLTRMK